MDFGFSFVGLMFLVMLFVPNMIWSKYQPKGYDEFSKHENRLLLVFERTGQVLVTIFSLFCGLKFNSYYIFLGFAFLAVYELAWINYFKSDITVNDFYSSFLKIPLPLAVLPIFAFLFLGLASNNIFLIISTMILAIGHIGIHYNHKKEL